MKFMRTRPAELQPVPAIRLGFLHRKQSNKIKRWLQTLPRSAMYQLNFAIDDHGPANALKSTAPIIVIF